MTRRLLIFFIALSGLASPPSDLMQEIADAETLIGQKIRQMGLQVVLLDNDPVRGYDLGERGVLFVVPLRYHYRTARAVDLEFPELAVQRAQGQETAQNPRTLDQKIKAWRGELMKQASLKEANFEKAVNQVKALFPQLVSTLQHLSPRGEITVIVEEREPSWVQSSFTPKSHLKRRLVRLELNATTIAAMRGGAQGNAWHAGLTRSNGQRLPAAATTPASVSQPAESMTPAP